MTQMYPKNIALKLKNYGDKCHYCAEELWRNNFTIDHLVPLGQGGLDVRSNKVACCRRCNEKKGSLTLQEFRPIFFYMTGLRFFAFEPEWATQKPVREEKRRLLFPKSSSEVT
jgi:hypothetical protein